MMNVIMKQVYEQKILPIILNPPVQATRPQESSFSLETTNRATNAAIKRNKDDPKGNGSQRSGCCK